MTDQEKQKQALLGAVNEYLTSASTIGTETDLPVLASTASIQWPNIDFKPTVSEVWARVNRLPVSTQARAIGRQGMDERREITQIDINVPIGTGEGVLEKWYEKARLYFPSGRSFTVSGKSVTVTACQDSTNRLVLNHFRKSISITFRADIKRATY